MRLFSKLSISLLALMMMGCAAQIDETYSPSIAALMPNETLVMKYSACHSGCDKGVVKFKNNIAIMKDHTLELTQVEVANLDHHFLSADDVKDSYFCSLRVMIGFKKKEPWRLSVKRKQRLYHCSFADYPDIITPDGLVAHFNRTPYETPFWRRPPEERFLKIED